MTVDVRMFLTKKGLTEGRESLALPNAIGVDLNERVYSVPWGTRCDSPFVNLDPESCFPPLSGLLVMLVSSPYECGVMKLGFDRYERVGVEITVDTRRTYRALSALDRGTRRIRWPQLEIRPSPTCGV